MTVRLAFGGGAALFALATFLYFCTDIWSIETYTPEIEAGYLHANSEVLSDSSAPKLIPFQEAEGQESAIRVGSSQRDIVSLDDYEDPFGMVLNTHDHLGGDSTNSTAFGAITPSHKGEYMEPADPFEFFGVRPSVSLLGFYSEPIHPTGWFAGIRHARRLGEQRQDDWNYFGVSSKAAHLGKPDP